MRRAHFLSPLLILFLYGLRLLASVGMAMVRAVLDTLLAFTTHSYPFAVELLEQMQVKEHQDITTLMQVLVRGSMVYFLLTIHVAVLTLHTLVFSKPA